MRNQLLVATGSTLEAIKNPPKGGQNTKNVMGWDARSLEVTGYPKVAYSISKTLLTAVLVKPFPSGIILIVV